MKSSSWQPAAVPEPQYPDVGAWVEGFLLPTVRRPEMAWCHSWWRHPEARERVVALWQSWEKAHSELEDGLLAAMSAWWIYHADNHLNVLGSPRGPFARCSDGHVDEPPARSAEPIPKEVP